jgi:hypothetical protein
MMPTTDYPYNHPNIQSITNLITTQAVQHIIINDRQSFELYGFDVLIDSDLKVDNTA